MGRADKRNDLGICEPSESSNAVALKGSPVLLSKSYFLESCGLSFKVICLFDYEPFVQWSSAFVLERRKVKF